MINTYLAFAGVPTPNYNINNVGVEEVATNASTRSCQNNREFILSILQQYLSGNEKVFEVGTGTADQTVYFCEKLPKVTWQTSDRDPFYIDLINKNIIENHLEKQMKAPVHFQAEDKNEIPEAPYDIVYASNVVHCMPLESTEQLFSKASTALKVNGLMILYGPFKVDSESMSEGNQKFDEKLKRQDPRLGLRFIDSEINAIAKKHGFESSKNHFHAAAKNWVLIFKKTKM